MHVRGVKVARDAELGLLRLDVAESSLHRFLHRSGNAAGHLQLPGSARNRNLQTVEADRSVGRYAGGVDGSGRQRIGGDQVAPSLFGNADEPLLAGLLERVAERCLIILEGAHLLELLLHAPPTFKSQLENLRELFLRHLAVREEDLHQTRTRSSGRPCDRGR